MLGNTLALEPQHTTVHVRAYSGDLAQLVSHHDGDKWHQPHDYVSTKKLRKFLIKKRAITGEELPLDGGTNGTKFWSFHPNPEEHRRIIQERAEKYSIAGRFFIYSPDNPMGLGDDGCSLVTSAFVATQKEGTYEETIYIPTKPENFTPESVLLVSTSLQIKPGLFRDYAGGRLRDYAEGRYRSEDRNKHVNAVLTDLRNRLCEEAGEGTMLNVDFGYGIYLQAQGITLRTAGHDDYHWAQEHTLPALKEILSNPSVGDAVVIRRELAKIPLPSSSDVTDNSGVSDEMTKLLLAARREANQKMRAAGQKIIDDTFANHYKPTIEKALRSLESDEDVVRALKLM